MAAVLIDYVVLVNMSVTMPDKRLHEPENSMQSLKCDIKAFFPSLESVSRIKNSFLMMAT